MAATEILAAATAALSVAKVAWSLGVEMLPQIKILFDSAVKMLQALVKGEEITDEELAELRAKTDELNELCAKYEKENFGIG